MAFEIIANKKTMESLVFREHKYIPDDFIVVATNDRYHTIHIEEKDTRKSFVIKKITDDITELPLTPPHLTLWKP